MTCKESSLLLAASVALAAALYAAPASAEVFRYTDRAGRAHLVPVGAEDPRAPALGDPPLPRPAPQAAAPEHALLASPAAASPSPEARSPALVNTDPSLSPYYSLASEAAATYSLPVELLLAVIKIESGFNPQAVSRKGAIGLMQLMPQTAVGLGVSDPFDPRQNILGGACLLRSLVNDFDGQLSLALAAYNAGAGAVRRSGGIPPIAETQSYVPAVLLVYRGYAANGSPRAPSPQLSPVLVGTAALDSPGAAAVAGGGAW